MPASRRRLINEMNQSAVRVQFTGNRILGNHPGRDVFLDLLQGRDALLEVVNGHFVLSPQLVSRLTVSAGAGNQGRRTNKRGNRPFPIPARDSHPACLLVTAPVLLPTNREVPERNREHLGCKHSGFHSRRLAHRRSQVITGGDIARSMGDIAPGLTGCRKTDTGSAKRSAGAEARLILDDLTARLKSCPSQNSSDKEFFFILLV
jgi:hypothetical protein